MNVKETQNEDVSRRGCFAYRLQRKEGLIERFILVEIRGIHPKE